MRRLTWFLALSVALVALALGSTWVYLNLVRDEAPARLDLGQSPAGGTGSPGSESPPATFDGTWTVTSGSQVGYRVDEVLFGQDATAVGRTDKVTGSLTLTGTTVGEATFTVDMASVRSDQSRRDNQYRGRIMSTDQFPTSTFRLTKPIPLSGVPADGATVTAAATGDLTLRGTTKSVTFDVKARRTGARFEVTGSIPIVFAEWGIPNPSFGPASVEDRGELEFLLVFAKG